MTRGKISCELVGLQDQKTYTVSLDVQVSPLHVDEESAAVGDKLQNEQLTPGQMIPDGDYTRRPHQFDTQEKHVRVKSGKMYAG